MAIQSRRAFLGFLGFLGIGKLLPAVVRGGQVDDRRLGGIFERYGGCASEMIVCTYPDDLSAATATWRWDVRRMDPEQMRVCAQAAAAGAPIQEVTLIFDPPVVDPTRPGHRLEAVSERVLVG